MNETSRYITGGLLTFFGIILLSLPIFSGFIGFIAWFYGLPLLVIGFFILFNKKEDEIEKIKSQGGKK